jgi:hypothetical protein
MSATVMFMVLLFSMIGAGIVLEVSQLFLYRRGV